MKRLCTICARGGSKGVKNKNLRLLNGKPLMKVTIEQARKSGLFTTIAVSSDSDDILKLAEECGVDLIIKRPEEMATDTAGKIPAIRHALIESEKRTGHIYDVHVDLDCTSPLRNVDDIKGAVKLLEDKKVMNVLTGSPARRSPYFNLVETNDEGVVIQSKKLPRPIVRRQDAPKCYDMNASIYVWTRDAILNNDGVFLKDTQIFEMPEERSHDIDTEFDFELVNFMASKRDDL